MKFEIKNISGSNKKIKIYDGFEDDFYESQHMIMCPICNENIDINVLKLTDFHELDVNLRIAIRERIKNINTLELSTMTTYSYEHLSVMYSVHTCIEQQNELISIFAIGEWQPARYQIILLGMFKITKFN
ncbi:hypothetical protein M5U04_10945 [Xenorhabdus sp. XENO-1]|uniref:hypothetical protein n=1 Tax=Xenorhabdus bovienii TaxID=40576 RepID=UPI0020CA590C|nr:hypothetical protein [Xenorhabdus bovienii]MCP9268598.1 hypothetical protein [Xenorhabdus bovienii subsp. africana]